MALTQMGTKIIFICIRDVPFLLCNAVKPNAIHIKMTKVADSQ